MISLKYNLVQPLVIETFFKDIDMRCENNLLIRPKKLSVCKADLRYYFGERDTKVLSERLPMTLIHEACGEVVFDPKGEFHKGEKVVLLPNIAGTDQFYSENYRLDSRFRSSKADGFMQEVMQLDRIQTVKYSSILPDNVLAFTEFISVGFHAVESFRRVAHERRENVAVWGDGALSYVVCCVLKSYFPNIRVTVIGVNPVKLQYFTFVDEVKTTNQIKPGALFDHTFECVGGQGSAAAINQMIDTLRPEGLMSLLGVSEELVPINTRMVLEKGLSIIGRSRSSREDFAQAVAIMEQDNVFLNRMKRMISEEIDIHTINDISRAFEAAKHSDFKVIMNWQI